MSFAYKQIGEKSRGSQQSYGSNLFINDKISLDLKASSVSLGLGKQEDGKSKTSFD